MDEESSQSCRYILKDSLTIKMNGLWSMMLKEFGMEWVKTHILSHHQTYRVKKTGKKLEDFPTHMFYLCRLRLKDVQNASSAVVVVVVVGCYSPSHRSMGKWMDGGASPDKDICHTA